MFKSRSSHLLEDATNQCISESGLAPSPVVECRSLFSRRMANRTCSLSSSRHTRSPTIRKELWLLLGSASWCWSITTRTCSTCELFNCQNNRRVLKREFEVTFSHWVQMDKLGNLRGREELLTESNAFSLFAVLTYDQNKMRRSREERLLIFPEAIKSKFSPCQDLFLSGATHLIT